MRILYTVHGYKPAYRIGGPIHSVSAVAENLVRKGHQVTVFTSNSNLDEDLDVPLAQPVDVDGVEVWYFPRHEFFKRYLPFVSYLSKSIGFLYSRQMRDELDRLVPQVDVVHTQMPFIYPTYAAAKAARKFNKPLFYHQRGTLMPERLEFRSIKKRLYIQLIEKQILRQAVCLIALAQAEEQSYRLLGLQNPIRVIPNGVAVEKYRRQMDPAQTRWNFPPDAQVVLFIARLHPIKGAHKLIQSFLQIQNKFPKAILVMAGPDEFGIEESFRADVQRAGAGERILFPGMVTGEDKINLLARADMFCLPSDAEGFSMSVLEALASGTPVVLSPGCNFPEVETAGAGCVVNAECDVLADAMAKLLADPPAMRRMGEAGLKLVQDNYTWASITQQMVQTYEEGIERHRAASKG